MDNNHRWANQQVKALIEAGVNPLDAQRSATWVLAHAPVGADPNTWIPSVYDVDTPLNEAAIRDARSVWYANDKIPAKYKRLLDAQLVTK